MSSAMHMYFNLCIFIA